MPGCRFWTKARDGDRDGLALYERHYSCKPEPRKVAQFVGPGKKLVLISPWDDALFVWRRFKYSKCRFHGGVNCAVFRNESSALSSDMIREADAIAWERWPGERHYTYVDPRRVKSRNPGWCFQCAGWRRCGETKTGMLVFERMP